MAVAAVEGEVEEEGLGQVAWVLDWKAGSVVILWVSES